MEIYNNSTLKERKALLVGEGYERPCLTLSHPHQTNFLALPTCTKYVNYNGMYLYINY